MADVYKQSFKQNYTNNIELSIFNCGLERCAPGIRIFSNKKVVVNQIIYAAVCNTGRNIHRFVLCIGVNIDFQARRILFGLYSDMFCGMPGRALPILSDVKCASEFTLII